MCKSSSTGRSSKAITVFVIGAAIGAIVGCFVISENKIPARYRKAREKEKKGELS